MMRASARRLLISPGRPASPVDRVWDAVLLLTILVAVSVRTGTVAWPGTPLVLFAIGSWVPLLFRTRYPELVCAAVVLVGMGQLLLLPDLGVDVTSRNVTGAYQPIPLAIMLAVYTVASRRRPRDAWFVAILASALLTCAALLGQSRFLVGTTVIMVQLIVIAGGIGVLVRVQSELRHRRAASVEDEMRRAVVDERLRIARELHDTLAHNLTLVDAQAAVADYLLDRDPAAARDALRGITSHTTSAIDDLRASLVLLRSERTPEDDTSDPTQQQSATTPVPTLADVEGLVERLRESGADIAVRIDGPTREMSSQTDLAAYRIVQEALTNATKHARGTHVDVTIRWTPTSLEISVVNSPPTERGHTTRTESVPGTGHGLLGLSERASAVGGTCSAGDTSDGGWSVRAELPLGTRQQH